MPKLACRCGKIIDLSSVPVEEERLSISNEDLDQMIDLTIRTIENSGNSDTNTLREMIADAHAGIGVPYYICPHCRRIICIDPASGNPRFYIPEE